MARFATSLLIALVALEIGLPTGCIGLQAIVGDKLTIRQRKLEAMRAAPAAVASWANDTIISPADALRLWGEPNRRLLLPGGREVWKYGCRDMRWRGVVVWAVVVPVPLLVPTGRRKLWLEFTHDSLTQVTRQSAEDRCYGLFLFQPMGGKSMSTLLQVH